MTHWHIGPNFHNFVQRVMDWKRMEITFNLLTHNDSCEEVRPMKSLDLYKLSPSKTTKLIFAWFTSTRDMGWVDAKDTFIWLLMKVFPKASINGDKIFRWTFHFPHSILEIIIIDN